MPNIIIIHYVVMMLHFQKTAAVKLAMLIVLFERKYVKSFIEKQFWHVANRFMSYFHYSQTSKCLRFTVPYTLQSFIECSLILVPTDIQAYSIAHHSVRAEGGNGS